VEVSIDGRDAERWRLRAEEYRAMGDISTLRSTRGAYLAMAEQCDRIANQADGVPVPRRLKVDDCLGYAEQCEDLARKLSSPKEQERMLLVAEQWRKLAQRGDTP
jgi:hypothetical protein